MGDVLEKIFAVILIVILMFFFPLLDSFERMDDLSYMTVYSATVKFVDAVRNTGHITPAMYTEFMQMIDATGNTYVVEMVHRQENYYPSPIASGDPIKLYDENYTSQILNVMTGGVAGGAIVNNYDNFKVGDYFYVSVKNTNYTPATTMKNALMGQLVDSTTIMVPYGGMIRNFEEI